MRILTLISARILAAALVVSPLVSPLTTAGSRGTARADDLAAAVRQVLNQVDPMIVRLRPVGRAQSADGVSSIAPTTGLVVSTDGEILTSAFALRGDPATVLVETQSGDRYPAEIVATDFLRKLVLLRTGAGQWTAPAVTPRTAARTGQWVIAVGRYYSSQTSNVAVGIVSARDRIHGLAVQTDARVSPMNYGGPLVDLDGHVHGIVVPLSPAGSGEVSAGVEWYDSGIGFAIPLEDALRSVAKLRSGKDLRPGLLGIALSGDDPFSPEVVIARVHPGGPAETAGVQPQDRIVAVNGTAVDRRAVLESAVARSYAGDVLQLKLRRGEQQRNISVTLAEQLPVVRPGFLGLLPLARPLPNAAGAAPEADAPAPDEASAAEVIVLQQGPAAAAGLSGRITILKVNETEIPHTERLTAAVAQLTPGRTVTLQFRRAEQSEPETISLTTTERPQALTAVQDQDRQAWLQAMGVTADSDAPPAREDLPLNDLGHFVLLKPGQLPAACPHGLVVLLSTAGQSEESILRRWQPVMNSHALAVAIPANPENTPLSSEDLQLLSGTLMTAITQGGTDRARIVAVAAAPQADMAVPVLLGARSPVRGLAMETGWIALPPDVRREGLANRSVLLLDEAGDRQQQALLQQAVRQLQDGGVQVLTPATSNSTASNSTAAATAAVGQIADLTLLLKAL